MSAGRTTTAQTRKGKAAPIRTIECGPATPLANPFATLKKSASLFRKYLQGTHSLAKPGCPLAICRQRAIAALYDCSTRFRTCEDEHDAHLEVIAEAVSSDSFFKEHDGVSSQFFVPVPTKSNRTSVFFYTLEQSVKALAVSNDSVGWHAHCMSEQGYEHLDCVIAHIELCDSHSFRKRSRKQHAISNLPNYGLACVLPYSLRPGNRKGLAGIPRIIASIRLSKYEPIWVVYDAAVGPQKWLLGSRWQSAAEQAAKEPVCVVMSFEMGTSPVSQVVSAMAEDL